MKKISLLFTFLLVFSSVMLFGQDFSNKGKDFWITYPSHINNTASAMGIYITSDVNATGTITVGSRTINFTVTANMVTTKFIGPNGSGDAPNTSVYLAMVDGVTTGAAIHVVSDKPVVVYAHIIYKARSGAALILPTSVWGKQYVVPSYQSPNTIGESENGYAAITVVAKEANTTVRITPTAASRNRGRPANVPFEVLLESPGDVYQILFEQHADISGTTVQSVAANGNSCKSIAVFSSTTWSAFGCTAGRNSSGDNLYQQLFPTTAWGRSFLTAPFKTRKIDIIRVFVTDPSTVVTKQENGTVVTLTGLVNNSFYEFSTGNSTFIKGDKPISVVQYVTTMACPENVTPTATIGDPEMIVLNPIEQTINNITVFSAHKNWVPANQSNVDHCYLNIIIKSNSTASFKINNALPTGSFVAIPGTDYSYLQEEVTSISATNPVQNLKADSNFIAIAYGFGDVESYGYNAGTNVKDFSQVIAYQNPYQRIDSAVTCVNTPLQLSVPFNFQPTSIRWNFTMAPNISPNSEIGPVANPSADSTTSVNGQNLYYYGPGKSFQFSSPNTTAVRDTIKVYTTSATPDGCGGLEQVYLIPIKVTNKPVAKFEVTSTGCVSDEVLFADQSTTENGRIIRWQWDFGDATTSDQIVSPVQPKKYTTGGDHNVKLKVISDVGCISDEVTQTVKLSSKPTASFTASPTTCLGQDVTFTDASSSTVGTLDKWTWNLDNGAGPVTFTTNTPQTTKYTSYGNKNVTLQVETTTGCKSDIFSPTTPVHINPLPEPGFTLPEVCQNDAFAQFTDTSKIVEGTIKSYLWKFNDGSPAITPPPNTASSTAKDPAVHYNIYGNYKVSLSVTSQLGCVTTKTVDFTVNGSTPKADFEFVNATPYCDNKPVQLKNKSTVDFGNVTKLEIYWDYVNNPTVKETIETPVTDGIYSHTYPNLQLPNAQQYAIRVVAYSGSAASCSNELTKTITVYSQPKAAFNPSVSELCFGDIVNFTDLSNGVSGAITTWTWDLGKGDKSAAQNPSKQYNDSGAMQVSLYVVNAVGCTSDTAVKQLTVYPNPKLTLTNNMTVLVGGTITLAPVYVYGNDLQYKWTPPAYLSSDTASKPQAMPIDDITYRLTVTAQGGCAVSDTVFIRVLKSPDVPNAFSPNGDGINDTWKIKYLEGYPGATVDVFNRYGQAVFKSAGYNSEWNGTLNGNPLPVGTYYYIINPKNGRQIITGSVTIIK